MKTTTIEKRKQELEVQLRVLEIVESVLEDLHKNRSWDAMNMVSDPETGEFIYDDEGNHVYEVPSEDDWRYHRYQAYQEVIKHIEKLINCK